MMFLIVLIFIEFVHCQTDLDEFQISHCGDRFEDIEFTLTSENYPSEVFVEDCIYTLKGTSDCSKFNVEFLDFNLTDSVGCLEFGRQDAVCGFRNDSKIYRVEDDDELQLKFVGHGSLVKGFRLLIKQLNDCDTTTTELSTTTEIDSTTTKALYKPGPAYLPPPLIVQPCCQNSLFLAKEFFISSPNFPYSINQPTDCTFVIQKHSSLVCRLRLNVLFFNLPYESCLEIDGKSLCGCNTNRQFTVNFGDNPRKVLRFTSQGYSALNPKGFLLEVFQDECQKISSPRVERSFRFYEDQDNRIQWPTIQQLKLINQKSSLNYQGNIFKHFYFFGFDDDELTNSADKEDVDFVDISTLDSPTLSSSNSTECLRWNNNQFIRIQQRLGTKLQHICDVSQQAFSHQQCTNHASLRGSLASPYYPQGYPENTNSCYSWTLLPGYCAIELFFRDFNLESSYNCVKDYLEIDELRYCANYLYGKLVVLRNPQINFVTDFDYCRRGFWATYRQLPCRDPCNTPQCSKVLMEKKFFIKYDSQMCEYTIIKNNDKICSILLNFHRFNMDCNEGHIEINGNKYCGNRSGQSIQIDIESNIKIEDRRPNGSKTILIEGEQIECELLQPDPVR